MSPPVSYIAPHARRSACDTAPPANDAYNIHLHVAALFIILFVSTTAAAFPLLASRFPRLRIPPRFFFIVRHFGTGVLLATAFCHLLPTAFVSLNNSCLSEFWTKDYPAMPGAISLGGIFLVVVIEMVFHPSIDVEKASPLPLSTYTAVDGVAASVSASTGPPHLGQHDKPQESTPVAPTAGRTNSASQQNAYECTCNRAPSGRQQGLLRGNKNGASVPEQQRLILQCTLLEIGILFHSVFIGMALSVSVGNDFVVLLVAIAFHQTFEGLALGARIASIDWAHNAWRPWLMALAYGSTTPVGQAIGLATHSLYSPTSTTGLVMVGTMNAISSGLLIFASLVELLAEDLLSDHSHRSLKGRARVHACLWVFAGAFSMSLVGAWA